MSDWIKRLPAFIEQQEQIVILRNELNTQRDALAEMKAEVWKAFEQFKAEQAEFVRTAESLAESQAEIFVILTEPVYACDGAVGSPADCKSAVPRDIAGSIPVACTKVLG
jgi:cytochrome c556